MEVHQSYFFDGKFSLGISQNCLGKLDIFVKSKLWKKKHYIDNEDK